MLHFSIESCGTGEYGSCTILRTQEIFIVRGVLSGLTLTNKHSDSNALMAAEKHGGHGKTLKRKTTSSFAGIQECHHYQG